jgi:cell division protein YceG involved in septum cleavage
MKSELKMGRAMSDADGPVLARAFYERLFQGMHVDVDSVPYALDEAVTALRGRRVTAAQWATFIHMGA